MILIGDGPFAKRVAGRLEVRWIGVITSEKGLRLSIAGVVTCQDGAPLFKGSVPRVGPTGGRHWRGNGPRANSSLARLPVGRCKPFSRPLAHFRRGFLPSPTDARSAAHRLTSDAGNLCGLGAPGSSLLIASRAILARRSAGLPSRGSRGSASSRVLGSRTIASNSGVPPAGGSRRVLLTEAGLAVGQLLLEMRLREHNTGHLALENAEAERRDYRKRVARHLRGNHQTGRQLPECWTGGVETRRRKARAPIAYAEGTPKAATHSGLSTPSKGMARYGASPLAQPVNGTISR